MRQEAQPTPAAHRALVYPAIVALFFAVIAPTLSWLEFSSSLENLNIATALELRRDHPTDWLIPTLEREPRIKKPPLTAWLTAHAIRPATVAAMSDADPAVRRAAADRLAFEARWPSLLAACLTLLAVYELGRVLAGPSTGLVAALVAGTTIMFLRFGRTATIDVHLGLWVTVANVGLAHALFKRRRWCGCAIAGVALGLAFMTKGPVGLVQSVLPVMLFVIVAKLWWPHAEDYPDDEDFREPHPIIRTGPLAWLGPITLGLLLMLAVAAPWYLYVYRTVPGALDSWIGEATEERGERPSKPTAYLAFLPYLLPWTIAFLGGIVTTIASRRRAALLAVVLAIAPLIVMTLYKDRKERYIYPVTAAAAVVAAVGVVALARKREPWSNLERFAVGQHWLLLVLAGVVLPAVAATPWVKELTTITGEPWLTRTTGAALTVAMGLAIAAAMLVRRRWLAALLAATLVVALAIHTALLPGYARTEAGLSVMRPLAEAIWRQYPDAQMYNAHYKTGKRVSVDLSIYLNRPTEWISMTELSNLKPGPRPRVVAMLQDHDGPPPTPPPGWKVVHKVKRDKDHWWAFALPAAEAAGGTISP